MTCRCSEKDHTPSVPFLILQDSNGQLNAHCISYYAPHVEVFRQIIFATWAVLATQLRKGVPLLYLSTR